MQVVPVAFEVARALDAELDILFVRKLDVSGYEELGIGAVVDGADPQLILNEHIAPQLGPTPDYFSRRDKALAEIDRRRQAYLGDVEPIPIEGRRVIIVDDGIGDRRYSQGCAERFREGASGPFDLCHIIGPA